MTRTEPPRRLESIGLLPDTPVTVVGRGQVAVTAAEILRVVGAAVTVVDSSVYEVDLAGLSGAALVVCDIVEDGATPEYVAAVAGRSGGAWVTVSAFGLDGPKGGEKGSDLVCAAAGGLLQSVADPDGGVHALPGLQALRAAGQAAALAALHALSLVRGGQEPVHLDVSVQEAVAYCAIPQPAAGVLYDAETGGGLRFGTPAGSLPCVDGDVSILVIDDHQWNRLVAAMGHPPWTEAYPTLDVRRAHADEIQAAVAEWTRTRSKFEVEGVFQAHGVAACAVRTLAEVVSNEHFLARDFLRPSADGRLACATFPALTTALPPGPVVVDASSRTLAGMRIAEITNVLAGPLAGATLAAMGATSVRFEEPQRLDLYRRNGPFQSGVPGLERAAYYLIGNFSKRNVNRRVGDPEFAAAVNVWADLVLENVGGGRLERLGLTPPAGVTKTLISMSGFGRTGPAADYKAYANNVQAFAGMAGAVRELSDPEAVVGTAIADCNIALWAATLAAAWWLGGAQPYRFDLSMAEIVASNLNGAPLDVTSAAPPAVTPDLILRCTDGSVAVATGSRPYDEALAALGLDQGQVPVRVAYAEAAADLIPTARTVEDVLQAVDKAGFAAYRSLGVAEVVLRDAQLAGRGFVVRLEHPEVGVSPILALPWKVAGTSRDTPHGWYRRSSLLGEDDDWFDEQLLKATTGN